MINLSCNRQREAVAGAIVFTDVYCYTYFHGNHQFLPPIDPEELVKVAGRII
jgi:hypothetical protein